MTDEQNTDEGMSSPLHPSSEINKDENRLINTQDLKDWLSAINPIINFLGVIAVFGGVWVAYDTLTSIKRSVEVSIETLDAQIAAVESSRAQFAASRDSLRLQQRAWLRFDGFALQVHTQSENNRYVWRNMEIAGPDDPVRIRLAIVNSGRTPALNVQLSIGNRNLAVLDYIDEQPDEWDKPIKPQRGVVVMPGEQARYIYTPSIPILPSLFDHYKEGSVQITLWIRLHYCDIYQRRHSMTTYLVRPVGDDPHSNFVIREQYFGAPEGEADHEDCRISVEDAPQPK